MLKIDGSLTVSMAGDLPLATEDSIFDDIPCLALLRP